MYTTRDMYEIHTIIIAPERVKSIRVPANGPMVNNH